MPSVKYTYSIQNDTLNGLISSDRLSSEIRGSSIITALDYIGTVGDICDIWFKASLSGGDEIILTGLVNNHNGTPLPDNEIKHVELHESKTQDGRLRVAYEKSSGTSFNFYSHDWCDKTTWYQKSTMVVDEIASPNIDFTQYTLVNQKIIDTYHGKLTQEDFLVDSNNNSYRVIVKVNNVTKIEQDPHTGSGGDYTINYNTGIITFLSALTVNDEVKVTYHYSGNSDGNSTFTIKPLQGKKLVIDIAEIQFSKDISPSDTIIYQPYGYVDVFAPQLLQSNGGPYPSLTQIPLGNPFVYKGIKDFLNDSFKAYPTYPIMGSGWRGISQESTIFEWDYTRQKELISSYGMEIRCRLQHDVPFGGTFGTVTFYCSSVDE